MEALKSIWVKQPARNKIVFTGIIVVTILVFLVSIFSHSHQENTQTIVNQATSTPFPLEEEQKEYQSESSYTTTSPFYNAGEKIRETKDTIVETVTGEKAQELYGVIKEKGQEAFKDFRDGYNNATPEYPKNNTSVYKRDFFGHGWAKVNGCDTRNIILQRDLHNVIMKDSCIVLSGDLHDPYTGENIHFNRGKSNVDIDHIVPLKWAWEHGASQWSETTREKFANDPQNLVAVHSSENRAKSDKSPNEWKPQYKPCEYTQKFVEISQEYGLDTTGITTCQ